MPLNRLIKPGQAAVFLLAHWAVLVLVGLALIPPSAVEDGPLVCPFRIITGHNCPGCGMTRAFSAALHGDLDAAQGFNPMVVVVFPLFVLFALSQMFHPLKRPRVADCPSCSCPPRSSVSESGVSPR